jgi:hypothetical protein
MKKDSEINVTHGQCLKAMIINGLGYTNAPLYMTSRFYQDKDIGLLIGPGIEAEHLNDPVLGACPRIGLVLRESRFEIVFAVFSGE